MQGSGRCENKPLNKKSELFFHGVFIHFNISPALEELLRSALHTFTSPHLHVTLLLISGQILAEISVSSS